MKLKEIHFDITDVSLVMALVSILITVTEYTVGH